MKLVLNENNDFLKKKLNISKKDNPCYDTSWHYHAQYELLYISKSNGIRFLGDNVSQFQAGDLVLVGSNLPHLWLNDILFQKENEEVEMIVLKFSENFIGEQVFNNPEFSEIKKMLDQSKFGIGFGSKVVKSLHEKLIDIVSLPYPEQLIKFLDILNQLSMANGSNLLSTADMRIATNDNFERIDVVLKYISDNYAQEICLEEIADIACMTTNSFCRFFKKTTKKSFTEFLNEVRIRNASRILIQEKLAIVDVSFKVGFNSTTNFNKQFKRIVGATPKEFRLEMSSNLF